MVQFTPACQMSVSIASAKLIAHLQSHPWIPAILCARGRNCLAENSESTLDNGSTTQIMNSSANNSPYPCIPLQDTQIH